MTYKYYFVIFALLSIFIFSQNKKNETTTKVKNLKEHTGKVYLDLDEELNYTELDQTNMKTVCDIIKQNWESYLYTDKVGYSKYLSKNVRKMSQRNRIVADGLDSVLSQITNEWEAFERPNNIISEEMTLRHFNFWADDKTNPTTIIVNYWVEIEGGVRWTYDDQGLVLQVLKKEDGDWKIVYYIDGWSTDYDLDEEKCGEEPTFVFDYVYPVTDLKRAISFYTPLLGEPDFITPTQAIFGLNDPKFILDNTGLYGYSKIKQNLTNGYAIIYVENLQKEIKKYKENDVEFLENTDTKPKLLNQDSLALIKDVDGNVIVILKRNFASETGKTLISGFNQNTFFINASKSIAEAWMKKDTKTLSKWNNDNSNWFDISTILNRGIIIGSENLKKDLENNYWKNFGYSTTGIVGEWAALNIKETKLGNYNIVSYERKLTTTGNHKSKGNSQVMHIFNSDSTLLFTFINNSTNHCGLVTDLDYTACPITNIKKSKHFYTNQLQLGDPYSDTDWRGYWSNNSVYGIFTTDKESEGIPVANQTNGYISFCINSADEIYNYLKKNNAKFPVISSINDVEGIDKQPGYNQIITTDSEGNIVLFTEYTGKKK